MSTTSRPKPFALIILDGYGLNPNPEANAVHMANTPVLDSLFENCPHTTLCSFGERVGLPAGQMGNSEVGHLNIGGGRVVQQDLPRVNKAIADKKLGELQPLVKLCSEVKSESDRALHFIGLISQGGVHSDADHLQALIEEALRQGVKQVYVHCITDGRDRPTEAAATEVGAIVSFIQECRVSYPDADIRMASLIGRYFAMDRDKRWDRTQKAYDLLTRGEGETFSHLQAALADHYGKGQSDEFHEPVVLTSSDKDLRRTPWIRDGDGLLFFNFRADRMRQIVPAFYDDSFEGFEREIHPKLCSVVTLTQYDETYPLEVLFPPQQVPMHFGQVLSQADLSQLRIAETEKYPHVTYFFNGGVEKPEAGEDRIVVPSNREVPTYDHAPMMSAPEITKILCDKIENDSYDVYVVNYANGDMVGHTGNLDAAIAAIEAVDSCLGQVLAAIESKGGVAIVTADHGNAEQMIDYETKEKHTFHTTHPVPLIVVGVDQTALKLRDGGALCDIAPTVLALLNVEQPSEMTGRSLIA